ncbi:MAG: outer membrane beta-barrel protein [Methylotenera sp.]|nr:outer membrane beta-barrel protein [Oligoflexia bacterium]
MKVFTPVRSSVMALTALCLCSAPAARADIQGGKSNVFVGAMLGITSANQSFGTGIGFGINGGYFFDPAFGIGANLKQANFDNNLSATLVAVEGLYRVGEAPGLHLGVDLGTAKFSTGSIGPFAGSTSSTSFAYGLKAAYDYVMSYPSNFSLGADLSVMLTKPGTETITIFNPMATAKIWF